jgi:hypothetical protein
MANVATVNGVAQASIASVNGVTDIATVNGVDFSSPASVTFTDSDSTGSNLTVYTFSGLSLGTAQTGRKIVVGACGAGGGSARTITGITVAGSDCTLVKQGTADGESAADLYQVELASGTTGDVVVTFSGAPSRAAVGVFAVYDAATAVHDTGGSNANPATDTLNIPAGGVAIGYQYTGHGSTRTFTWTNLTEDLDQTFDGVYDSQTGASAAFATVQTGLAITCTPSGSTGRQVMVIASWGPA